MKQKHDIAKIRKEYTKKMEHVLTKRQKAIVHQYCYKTIGSTAATAKALGLRTQQVHNTLRNKKVRDAIEKEFLDIEKGRAEARGQQRKIMGMYLSEVYNRMESNGGYLHDTQEGREAIAHIIKLELKDRQIQAQLELGKESNNPLLLILKEAQQSNIIDITPMAQPIESLTEPLTHVISANEVK